MSFFRASLPHPPTSQNATLNTPTPLFSFSFNEKHEAVPDDSALKYFSLPPRSADLNYGYERWAHQGDYKRLDPLLHALLRDEDRFNELVKSSMSVITWRGMITKIMTVPYETRYGFEMNAMIVGGNIYIEEHVSPAQTAALHDTPPSLLRMIYNGYAFESYCTKPSPESFKVQGAPQGWSGDVETNVQWCHVVQNKLRGVQLILGGEVDCIKAGPDSSKGNLVELKTTAVIRPGKSWDQMNFKKKLCKFWAQSYLLGVPEIFVGFRSPTGILAGTALYKTSDIPKAARSGRGLPPWNPYYCVEYADRFLEYLRESMTAGNVSPSGSPVIWRLTFKPNEGIEVRALTDAAEIEYVNKGEDRVGFLPSVYFSRAL